MKQFFDGRAGIRGGRGRVSRREGAMGKGAGGGEGGDSLGGARKRVGGISEGPLSRLIFTDRISPGAGVTVSAVFTSRGNYIKSFCKGREN